jgi:hypothetical protein
MRLILVGCAKDKALPKPPDGPPWPKGYVKDGEPLHPRLPAKDLYVSPLFRKRRAYAEMEIAAGRADRWAIVSALHHVVSPERELGFYDYTMAMWGKSWMPHWGHQTAISLRRDLVCNYGELCDKQPRDADGKWQPSYQDDRGVWTPGTIECSGCCQGLVVEFHAGVDYVDPARYYLEEIGCIVETPVAGLQIGELLSWYNRRLRDDRQLELCG